jgi:Fe-S-cluster-containing dehydrogenase component
VARYGMLIDVNRCNGCYNCFLACRDEYAGNDYPPYSAPQPTSGQQWMRVSELERGSCPKVKVSYIPLPCLHCEDASCVTAAPAGTVTRREDGIVLIDPVKALGHEEIVHTCPHRVIYWNEERKLPQKCTFCAHLLDKGWKEPRCVEACPTGALVFGDWDDAESELVRRSKAVRVEEFHPEFALKPRVLYAGLPKKFIAGEVVLGDREGECGEGVQVTLIAGKKRQSLRTDNYGDFEFAEVEGERFTLRIEHPGYTPRSLKVRAREAVNLGEIRLKRATKG